MRKGIGEGEWFFLSTFFCKCTQKLSFSASITHNKIAKRQNYECTCKKVECKNHLPSENHFWFWIIPSKNLCQTSQNVCGRINYSPKNNVLSFIFVSCFCYLFGNGLPLPFVRHLTFHFKWQGFVKWSVGADPPFFCVIQDKTRLLNFWWTSTYKS